MALISPGVQVSVTDESFYTPAEPGTTPLLVIATKENKANPAGTGIAPGTLKSNAGKLYTISSQRELSETFGDAIFRTDSNNTPIHGGEQNEYGLQAAYSYLGVSNQAYVIRADIDLEDITASAQAPDGSPSNGTYWFDTTASQFGIFEWNSAPTTVLGGQSFEPRTPIVITDTSQVVDFNGGDYTPKASIGSIGSYAIVAVTTINRVWYKNNDGVWVSLGSNAWKASIPVLVGTAPSSELTAGEAITFITEAGQSAITADTSSLVDFVTAINTNMNTYNVKASITSNGRVALYLLNGEASVEIIGSETLLAELGITRGIKNSPSLQITPHTQVPEYKLTDVAPRPTGSVWIKTTTPNLGANWVIKTYSTESNSWNVVTAPVYSSAEGAIRSLDPSGGRAITQGSLYIKSDVAGIGEATFKIYRKVAPGETVIRSVPVLTNTYAAGIHSFSIRETVAGSADMLGDSIIEFTADGTAGDAESIAAAINAAGLNNVVAEVDAQNRVIIKHVLGGEIRITDTNVVFGIIFPISGPNMVANLYEEPTANVYTASLWRVLTYTSGNKEPSTIPESGKLWYSSIVDQVDIMVHNGTNWVGYTNMYPSTDPLGPIVSASEPLTQQQGAPLVDNDIWISTSDITNYPTIYRRLGARWVLVDKTDQTTENGVLFADARAGTSGGTPTQAPNDNIVDMLSSNHLDPDAPDSALYPRGMLLWNLRRSGFNIKRFERNYINTGDININAGDEQMNAYYPHRWVTESANNEDGSGSFGRIAQRKVVVQKLQELVNSNQDIRDDETKLFNLIACPGYPELIGEMITLNYDRGLTAFVVGDSPMRLAPDTVSISDWAANINNTVEDNDLGLVSRDEYLGVYYPSGFTSDNLGNNVVVPASHMALRTMALNDQVAYPWFAPAGTRRGSVTNATATGYISSEGEFVSVALNEGQRNTLYQNNVNPITFLNGSGLVVFGQKTRARNATALDRINVARLVIYLRRQLSTLSKPYLFEPNDKITRDEIKQQIESLMVELVGLRAIYDYLVVADESNNTPSRIDRNELYVDIAIEPVKAVEFIYIPLRLKNTGEIASL